MCEEYGQLFLFIHAFDGGDNLGDFGLSAETKIGAGRVGRVSADGLLLGYNGSRGLRIL